MASPVNDRGVDAFLVLLSEGGKGPGPKSEALQALSLRPVWLATWEPRAEGFRTLINPNGEEALAVFSCEEKLTSAATRFDWLEADGTIATHRAIGGDILRHAWTREYAYVVIDIGSEHSLEYERDELKAILREMDSTGPFRTSRPPPPTPPKKPSTPSSFPSPVKGISTMYSMAPSRLGKARSLERPTDKAARDAARRPARQRAADQATCCSKGERATAAATQKLAARAQTEERVAGREASKRFGRAPRSSAIEEPMAPLASSRHPRCDRSRYPHRL